MRQRKHPVVLALEEEVQRTLDDHGFELVTMKFGGPPGRQTLSIYIDKPGGVTADDCQYMSERLTFIIEMIDPVPGPYNLVVSSPGVDRPLTRDEDFERFAGETVLVRYSGEDGKRRRIRGLLEGLKEGMAVLSVDGTDVEVPLDDIEDANLIYDWSKQTADADESGPAE